MSVELYKAVCDARDGILIGYGLEEAVRQAAAVHHQDVARVAVLAAEALIARAHSRLALAINRRSQDDE